MSFSNGIKRAGFFKDNILYKLLTDESMIQEFEANSIEPLPEKFKQDLLDCLSELEAIKQEKAQLDREQKKNQFEEIADKNLLLVLQDAKNVPWGEGNDLEKQKYILLVRQKDAETQFERPTTNLNN